METENLHSAHWLDILIQWIFFFALVTVFLFPALRFRNLARTYNKKGWVYFILGLTVGGVGLNLGKPVAFSLQKVVPQDHYAYLSLIIFFCAYLAYWFSYRFLKRHFAKNGE